MVKFSALSHPGLRYEVNEDVIGCAPDLGLWLIADGMGGHAAGEVASSLARDTFINEVRCSTGLHDAALAAHYQIKARAQCQPEYQGMGTTLVAIQIVKGQAHMLWVGDSRAYLWRQGRLEQLTSDHSFVQLLIESGELAADAARQHPRRNMVIQVLGVADPVPDFSSCVLQAGDQLLLCSDGLNDELTDQQIAQAFVRSNGSVEVAAEDLLAQALDRGGRDNVSVIVIDPEVPHAVPGAQHADGVHSEAQVKSRNGSLLWRIAVISGLLVTVIFLWGAA